MCQIVALVTAGGFAVSLGGCADMIRHWPKQLNLTPPQTTELATPEHRAHEPAASTETHAAPSEPVVPVSTKPLATAAAPPKPKPKPTVTLSGEAGSRVRAEKLLSAAQSKLSGVDRTRLTGEDRVTYAQASNFVGAAQRAMQVRDYVTAAGLARKASLLADEVKTAGARPRP